MAEFSQPVYRLTRDGDDIWKPPAGSAFPLVGSTKTLNGKQYIVKEIIRDGKLIIIIVEPVES